MRSEALDIRIESRGHAVWLILCGPFHNEQVPNIREKIGGLIEDGNRRLVIDMEQTTSVGDSVAQMMLNMVSLIRGKGGDIKFIFKNAAVTSAFSQYRNILDIYPDAQSVSRGGLLGLLRHRRMLLSRKTGVRLSRPVAVFVLVVLCGWFLTLAFTILMQYQQIRQQEKQVHELTEWKQASTLDLQSLRDRLRPMEQMGLLRGVQMPRPPAPVAQKKPAAAPGAVSDTLSTSPAGALDTSTAKATRSSPASSSPSEAVRRGTQP
jgi:anti-anti-sigma regulatory factor